MTKRAMCVFVSKKRIQVKEYTDILSTALYSQTTSNFPLFFITLELLIYDQALVIPNFVFPDIFVYCFLPICPQMPYCERTTTL